MEKTFIDRLIIERDELGIKLAALNNFLGNDNLNNIVEDHYQSGLLFEQRDSMRVYYSILCTRVLLLTK